MTKKMTKKKKEYIDKARSNGLEIDPDGRVIYTKDRDARAGYKSANREGPAGVYKGYVVRIAVGCSTVRFYDDPAKVQLEECTSYVTALMVDPAGKNPGSVMPRSSRSCRRTP